MDRLTKRHAACLEAAKPKSRVTVLPGFGLLEVIKNVIKRDGGRTLVVVPHKIIQFHVLYELRVFMPSDAKIVTLRTYDKSAEDKKRADEAQIVVCRTSEEKTLDLFLQNNKIDFVHAYQCDLKNAAYVWQISKVFGMLKPGEFRVEQI
jgi:hypothetical protein